MTPASPGPCSVRTTRPVGFVIVTVTEGTVRATEYEINAPSFGLSPAYSPWPQFEKSSQNRYCVTGRAGNRCAGFAAIEDDHAAIGDASARIQILRPWVPSISCFARRV